MKLNLSDWAAKIKTNEKTYIPYAILFLALSALLGSLYFSNYGDPVSNLRLLDPFPLGAGLIPCRLCWYARILIYPIVPITLIGIWKKEGSFVDYVLPLAILGIPLEIYHYSLQLLPKSITTGSCDIFSPCNVAEVTYLGFITIPFLAFIAFTLIVWLSLRYRRLCKTKAS